MRRGIAGEANAAPDSYTRHFATGGEATGLRKDGSTFPMDLSVGQATQDGELIFVGIVHDLTARKLTEQQLQQAQKMETVGQLSGGIAHDFNNLLTVIVGNAEHLGEQLKARPDLRQFADDICESGERGAELTQRLLAFSRRQLLQPQAIDCRELLESMVKLLKRTLRESIEIRTAFGPGTILAFADRAQLESAVLNLALNAQDAMPSGGHLTLSRNSPRSTRTIAPCTRKSHPAPTPRLRHRRRRRHDADVIEHAFEPFFTTKEVGKGSGLGLSMVYGFAKQSDGHVSIYSEQGLGTTVRIYLPRAGAGQSSGDMLENDEAAPRGHETILIAEDDPFVRSSVIQRVEALGYRVVAAVNGKEALQRLRTDPGIDMLFTDIIMPGGMSGWDLAEQAAAASALTADPVHLRLCAGDPGRAGPRAGAVRDPDQALPQGRAGAAAQGRIRRGDRDLLSAGLAAGKPAC